MAKRYNDLQLILKKELQGEKRAKFLLIVTTYDFYSKHERKLLGTQRPLFIKKQREIKYYDPAKNRKEPNLN